jgi:hemolysin activation/secretion protein
MRQKNTIPRPGAAQPLRRLPMLGSVALACLLALAATPAAAQAPAAPSPATEEARFEVRGFAISGTSLIDSNALVALLARFKGQRTMAELRQAAAAVQDAYSDAGFGAVVAYLPPQAVADGTVNIAVVEGKVGKVTLKGGRRLTPERVRAALPSLVEGQTPRVRRIDSELQIANENPGRQVGVLLGPGAAPGEVEATVSVEEQSQHRFTAALDNTGNDRTGDWRLSLGYQNSDFLGMDDVLSLQGQVSPTEFDAVRVVSVGWRLPIVRWLSALDLFAATSNVDGGTTATLAGDLSFSGRGRIFGARFTRYLPRLGEFDQRLALALDHRRYLNACAIEGLGPEACGPAGASVTVNPLTLEYLAQRGGSLPIALNVAVATNLDLGGTNTSDAAFDAARPGAARQYTALRAGGSVTWPVMEEWSLGARVAVQHSGDALVPGEQFGLGGAGSVRGYREREVAGDRGLVAGLELTSPRLAVGEGLDFRVSAFAEGGEVTNSDGSDCASDRSRCRLAGAGIGARLAAGAFVGRLSVAQALEHGTETRRGDWRAHVSLSASF